jgi:hypothetical protein
MLRLWKKNFIFYIYLTNHNLYMTFLSIILTRKGGFYYSENKYRITVKRITSCLKHVRDWNDSRSKARERIFVRSNASG